MINLTSERLQPIILRKLEWNLRRLVLVCWRLTVLLDLTCLCAGVVVEDFKRRYEEYGITHYVLDYWDSADIEDLEYISEKIIKPLS